MERISRNAPTLLLAAALAVAAAMTLALTWEMTYFQDTWAYLIERREITADALFKPHNEHIVVIPVLAEQLFLRVFGMTSATPGYVLLVILLLATASLLFVYVRRRVGPWLALFAAVLVLCLGPAWEVLLWPFEISLVGPMAFGLAMLLALERKDRWGDIAACAFLVIAVGFSSLGLPFIAGAAVAILLRPREDWLRKSYVVLIPVALYAAWYLGWGHEAETHITLRNIIASPRPVADSIAYAVGSTFGLSNTPFGGAVDPLWGRALLVGLVLVVGYRQLGKPGFPAGLWPVAAVAASNWFLVAFNLFPGRDPGSSRYQYAGAIFVLMILANLFSDARVSRRVVAVAAVVTAAAIGPNLIVLKDGRDELKRQSILTRSDTAAIEISRRTVDPDFQLTPEVAGTPSLVNIYAGKYLPAVDEYGSPAYSLQELASAPEAGRAQADIVLAKALPISLSLRRTAYGRQEGGQKCVTVAGGARREVRLSTGSTSIELAPGPSTQFTMRRFAVSQYPVSFETAPGGSVTLLRIPRDLSPRPWYLLVDARQPTRVCR